MKVIVLGDIHGNLPALEVVLREARAEGYDILCHTGDLTGCAPFPEETVSLVRSAKVPGVRGHVDDRLAAGEGSPGSLEADPGVRDFLEKAYAWTLQHTRKATRDYLGNLPFELRFEMGGLRATLLHATPIDTLTCLWEDRDEDYFRELGDAAEADVILFGHTHRHYHRIVDGRHFINAGSVGFPQDGDPRTGYVVVKTNGNVEVQVRRYPYNRERLLRVAAARRFPHQAARVFRT
ncbi:MAG: metallophosphoesterase family protein [Acidobacteriota bacterium]